MVKSAEQLLKLIIHKAKSRPIPFPSSKSPLVTDFQKWGGRKKRLYFKRSTDLEALRIPDFKLDRNVFAKLLVSPMRYDRLSRVKLPRELMIQVKTSLDGRSLPSPMVTHTKERKNAYLVNSIDCIKESVKSAALLVPLDILTSRGIPSQSKALSERVDVSVMFQDYLRDLEEVVLNGLSSVKEISPKGVDVCVIYDESDPNSVGFKMFQLGGEERKLPYFNLGTLGDEKWKNTIYSSTKGCVSLNVNIHWDLIVLVYRLLTAAL